MLANFPKIGIVYLSFHSEPYLDDMVSALKKTSYPKDRLELIIVDNPHPVYGPSVRAIEENVLPLSGNELPHVTLLAQESNIGFSGGNNRGIEWAMRNGCEYVFLHNADGFLNADCLTQLVEAMERDKTIGAAQPLIMLHPETDLINSSGNSLQYLGIGYCNDFRVPKAKWLVDSVRDTNYASGAAIMMRTTLLKQFGLWDEDYFLYHEDIEYCLRMRLAGFRIVVVPHAVFYHKYNFSRNKEKFYYIERNRLGLLLTVLRIPTLVVLLPMGIVWELGMLWFAHKNGWLKEKLRTYGYWLKPSTWVLWYGKRKRLQDLRTISDHELLQQTVNTVEFMEKSINTPLVRYVANPLLSVYGALLRLVVFW
jgi:GT2 family glycosyltransferase